MGRCRISPRPAIVRGTLLTRSRRKRRPEDHGRHRRALGCRRCDEPGHPIELSRSEDLVDHLVVPCRHGDRHRIRRMAHRENDGHENREAHALRRLLRGDRRRDHALSCHSLRYPCIDNTYDYRSDHRCRLFDAVIRRPMGRRSQYRHSLDTDDPALQASLQPQSSGPLS